MSSAMASSRTFSPASSGAYTISSAAQTSVGLPSLATPMTPFSTVRVFSLMRRGFGFAGPPRPPPPRRSGGGDGGGGGAVGGGDARRGVEVAPPAAGEAETVARHETGGDGLRVHAQ